MIKKTQIRRCRKFNPQESQYNNNPNKNNLLSIDDAILTTCNLIHVGHFAPKLSHN